jgi:muramidase (phage lysozyme)
MRKRILLIAVPLVIVAIAASVAVASPSDAEHSRGPRLDRLHAERPIAATDSTATLSVTDAGYEKAVNDLHNYLQAIAIHDYLHSLAVQVVHDYILSLQAAEAAQAAAQAAPQPVSSAVYSNTYPGDFLSCVRNRESGGNYGVYNSGGSGAAGAYQFLPGTWNSIAASSGRGDLVGVDPAQASPADQDAMAQALYAQQGAAPWGGGC